MMCADCSKQSEGLMCLAHDMSIDILTLKYLAESVSLRLIRVYLNKLFFLPYLLFH